MRTLSGPAAYGPGQQTINGSTTGSLGLLTWLFERPLGKVLGRDLEDIFGRPRYFEFGVFPAFDSAASLTDLRRGRIN